MTTTSLPTAGPTGSGRSPEEVRNAAARAAIMLSLIHI